MEKKTHKFKFMRKNSPDIKTVRKIHPHYSKIINSIFNQIKEKENKTLINSDKIKDENGLNKNTNITNRKIFKLKTNRLKNLIITTSPSTITYNNDKNKTEKNSKKHKIKFDKKLLVNNINISKNELLKENNNISQKNIKIKKNFGYNPTCYFYQEKNGGVIADINIKKIYTKYVNCKNEPFNKIKKIKNINNKEKKVLNISNKNLLNNCNNDITSLNNGKTINHYIKKNILRKKINNFEIFIKKKNESKKIYKRNNDNMNINKTPITNFNNKCISKFYNNSTNTSISNFRNKNFIVKNSKKQIFSQKNKSNGKDKIFVINIREKKQKLDISNISLNNSCNSLNIDSKKIRSYSKKRDEYKIKNLKKNELYNERVNKKINNLYEYINELNNNIKENNSMNIKLIDKIRKNKKLNNNLYIVTQ